MIIYKIGVLKNLAKFMGKHFCWNHFLRKLQASGLQFIKKTLQHRCLPVNFERKPFLQNTFGPLLK